MRHRKSKAVTLNSDTVIAEEVNSQPEEDSQLPRITSNLISPRALKMQQE